MNRHSPTHVQPGTACAPRGIPARLRRVATVLTAVFVLLMTASTTFAQPASAAGGLGYCFKHTNGSSYTYDAYLQLWYNNQWNTVWNAGRSANGCKSITISGWWQNYPSRMLAFTQVGTYNFIGTTPYWAPAGAGSYNLGTGWVNM